MYYIHVHVSTEVMEEGRGGGLLKIDESDYKLVHQSKNSPLGYLRV